MATRRDPRSFAADRAPPANRRRLSGRDWKDIRQAIARLSVDDVYSVEIHGVKVVLRQHANFQQVQQHATLHGTAEPQLSNRQRRRRERGAERASMHRARQQERERQQQQQQQQQQQPSEQQTQQQQQQQQQEQEQQREVVEEPPPPLPTPLPPSSPPLDFSCTPFDGWKRKFAKEGSKHAGRPFLVNPANVKEKCWEDHAARQVWPEQCDGRPESPARCEDGDGPTRDEPSSGNPSPRKAQRTLTFAPQPLDPAG